MIGRLREHGPGLAPQLFTFAFLDRTALRFRYMAVHASRGTGIAGIAGIYDGWRRGALVWIDRNVPPIFRRTRVALVFLILRPFDIVPVLWTRLAGRMLVMARFRHSARNLRDAGQ